MPPPRTYDNLVGGQTDLTRLTFTKAVLLCGLPWAQASPIRSGPHPSLLETRHPLRSAFRRVLASTSAATAHLTLVLSMKLGKPLPITADEGCNPQTPGDESVDPVIFSEILGKNPGGSSFSLPYKNRLALRSRESFARIMRKIPNPRGGA